MRCAPRAIVLLAIAGVAVGATRPAAAQTPADTVTVAMHVTIAPPGGCHFHPRCPHAMDRCRTTGPALREVETRVVSCHLYDAS